MGSIGFRIEREDRVGGPRAGVVTTPHGAFLTPAFTLVGTKGSVKGVLPRDLKTLVGAEVVLSNTYHLFLQPGDELVKEAGGLHKFMGWDGPLVTDSGGFQVFSLGAAYGKGISKFTTAATRDSSTPTIFDEETLTQHGRLAVIDEEGVTFTSHIDGSLHRFTPERSIEIQHNLGADIFFAFDEATSPTASKQYQVEAMRRTHRWAERSLKAHRRNLDAQNKQAVFGIVQGGPFPDLRAESAKEIGAMEFDGFGIGGSYSKAELEVALAAAVLPLPPGKPRHLLGIGEPVDLFEGVANGIDMFDCVLPTRLGRTGTIFTRRGKVNLNRDIHARDFGPLDPEGGGYASENFTRAYVNHLFRANEMLGPILASLHNLHFIVQLMKDIRQSILDDRFNEFRKEFLTIYGNV